MKFQRQVSRRLHDEHVAMLELLGQFAQALGRLKTEPPAAGDPVWAKLLASLEAALQYEVSPHFDFEEVQLFPRLHQSGNGELAEMLFEEHEAIRRVVQPLFEPLARARAHRLDGPGWQSLKVSGMELVERLGSHAEKEQAALVPLIDELLDEQTDRELSEAYGLA